MRYFEIPIVDVNADGSLLRPKHINPGLSELARKADNSKCIMQVPDAGSLTDILTGDGESIEVLEVNLPVIDEGGSYT